MVRKLNLLSEMKSKMCYLLYVQCFLIMIWRSLLYMARNWQIFWKETRCNYVLFFFGSLWVLSHHWKHHVVGYKRLCPSYFVCFIFYFCFSARKNKGCRNCRYWKETGRKKKRNRQKHFWGNTQVLVSCLFQPFVFIFLNIAMTNSIPYIGICLVCLMLYNILFHLTGLPQVGIIQSKCVSKFLPKKNEKEVPICFLWC